MDLGITQIITETGRDADNSAGDPIANWLIENAEYIGIQRVMGYTVVTFVVTGLIYAAALLVLV